MLETFSNSKLKIIWTHHNSFITSIIINYFKVISKYLLILYVYFLYQFNLTVQNLNFQRKQVKKFFLGKYHISDFL